MLHSLHGISTRSIVILKQEDIIPERISKRTPEMTVAPRTARHRTRRKRRTRWTRTMAVLQRRVMVWMSMLLPSQLNTYSSSPAILSSHQYEHEAQPADRLDQGQRSPSTSRSTSPEPSPSVRSRSPSEDDILPPPPLLDNDAPDRDEDGEPVFPREVVLDDIHIARQFIDLISRATIDTDFISDDMKHRLHHPPKDLPRREVDNDRDLRLALRLFLVPPTGRQSTYDGSTEAVKERFGDDVEIPSYSSLRNKLEELTGVHSVTTHMCINSCVAFTGPYAHLDRCPQCSEPRYKSSKPGKNVPRQVSHTIPIGPQLQALYSTPEGSAAMRYRSETTSLILEELDLNEGALNEYGDFVCGSEYLESLADSPGDDTRGSKSIGENDICLMFSIDGAQLYESKKSDCWMFIWVIFELAPDKRYKKKHILPGGFIPGPNKPKDLDSFLFYSFHHLSALMKDGLRIWDALRDIEFMSYPFLIIASADGPGLAYLNGLNGHNGMYGCRLYCGLKGRLKPGSTRYYPALLKPDNYDVEGSNHPDASVHEVASHIPDSDHYYANLATLETSQNATQYKNNRKVTGISKPSILSGIPRKFDLPKCSGADLMHLISLNLTELLLLLWRGTMSCASTDDKATWDWCVLVGELWKTHGEQVAAAKSYLPGSFDRPPRNPAEKISSGYKAIEFLTYIYGLGPGIFYGVLPDKYWRNFCKLVYCVRRVHQHSITQEQLLEVNDMLKSFVTEFEELYYQRRADRLHFIRQSIHAVLHIPGEIPRMAMGLYYTQWSMERVIGDLGSEINQHSNPYANLSQRGVLRCQINALAAMVPNLVPESSSSDTVPESGEILGDGFILLRRKDRTARIFPGASGAAITAFFTEATSGQVHGNVAVTRWARLRLPTGQILRSAWKEDVLEPVRVSRISKAKINNAERIVEVKFYFRAKVQEETRAFALVSCFSEPDIRLLEASYKALYVCRYRGDDGLVVIDVKAMQSVVAMVPFHVLGSPHSGDGRLVAGQSYFLVEKLGLEMAHMAGFEETLADI